MTLPVAPPWLRPGSRVGVAAVSGPVVADRLAAGLEALEERGYRPVLAGNTSRSRGLFAGGDRERLDALHALLDDATLDAIFFARGGHGLLRLLPLLDWERIGERPRWYVGYSDLTPLLAAIVERCGWIAVHGPMVGVELADGLDRREGEMLDDLLGGVRLPELPIDGTDGSWDGVRTPLTGGCLSLLASTLGTPWAPSARDRVLFLEDLDEPLYRIDRMLQQLRLAGALEGVAGVVVGSLEPSDRPGDSTGVVLEAVREAVGAGVPLAWGCPSGHCRPNYPLPLGSLASVGEGKLRFELPRSSG